LKDGQAKGKTGRGVPVQESCRAPYFAPRPVRHGKKSGPAEGLQGRSVRGRVGQWQDGPVRERQLRYAQTSQPADHINRQLVKQQRRYIQGLSKKISPLMY
jgi:hypothetical protein